MVRSVVYSVEGSGDGVWRVVSRVLWSASEIQGLVRPFQHLGGGMGREMKRDVPGRVMRSRNRCFRRGETQGLGGTGGFAQRR